MCILDIEELLFHFCLACTPTQGELGSGSEWVASLSTCASFQLELGSWPVAVIKSVWFSSGSSSWPSSSTNWLLSFCPPNLLNHSLTIIRGLACRKCDVYKDKLGYGAALLPDIVQDRSAVVEISELPSMLQRNLSVLGTQRTSS